MNRLFSIVPMALLISLIPIGLSGQGDSEKSQSLNTAADAITKTLLYTGFDSLDDFNLKDVNITAESKYMSKVKIPFLWPKYADRNIWIVTINNVRLHGLKEGARDNEDSHIRTFTAYLDPTTGHLLRLHSKIEGVAEDYNKEPALDTIEWQLGFNELFLKIPDEMPKINFLNALRYPNTSVYEAKEIIAHYVTFTSNGWRDTLNVWSIDLRGLPIEDMGGLRSDLVEDYKKGHKRSILNIEACRLYGERSTPTTYPAKVIEWMKKEGITE